MAKKKLQVLDFMDKTPLASSDQDIWIGTSISLFRNLEKYKFPSKLESNERKQVLDFIGKALVELKALIKPKLFHGETLEPVEKEFLYEHFQGMSSFHQAHSGDGFVIDSKGRYLFVINVGEHLQMHSLTSTKDLESTFMSLAEIEKELNETLKFAFSKRFGFLTADVMHTGCAVEGNAFLQVPALIHTSQIEGILKTLDEEDASYFGLHQTSKEFLGNTVVISNQKTLGVSEEQILTSLNQNANRLLIEEEKARKHLTKEQKNHLKDLVSRACGLFNSPYQLEIGETLDAITLLKLGLSQKWLSGVTLSTLNQAFFEVGRAHLIGGQMIPQKELHQIELHRANYIRDHFKSLEIKV